MRKILLLLIWSVFIIPKINAQEYFPNNESTKNKSSVFIALSNAKIYVSPTQIIEKGTMLIKDGKVISVGTSVAIPKNAMQINLEVGS